MATLQEINEYRASIGKQPLTAPGQAPMPKKSLREELGIPKESETTQVKPEESGVLDKIKSLTSNFTNSPLNPMGAGAAVAAEGVKNIAQGAAQAPVQLANTMTAGAGALGEYAGNKLAGTPETLSQAYQNQIQKIKESGAEPVTQILAGQESQPAQTGEQLAGQVIGTVADVLPATKLGSLGAGSNLAGRIGGGAAAGAITGGTTGVGQAMQKDASTGEVVTQGLEGAAIGSLVGGVAGGLRPAPAPTVDDSINAVNPDLSGKKLTAAYKQAVTGKRTIQPASVLKEQALSPDEQAIKLGTRLKDLGLAEKDHIGNINKLGIALNDTETQLETALKGDPEIVYNLDKRSLIKKLNSLSGDKPEDFIGDNSKIYDKVIAFGKKTIASAEDTISGGRDARTIFDTAAKSKFKTAFKDGYLDTSTPAGDAIKKVRDIINEHIYDVAPNGSEIKNLIGREADIFKATEVIASKAAKGEGANAIAQAIKAHPTLAKSAAWILGILGLGSIAQGAKNLTGL